MATNESDAELRIHAATISSPDKTAPSQKAGKVTAYVILSGLIASCSGLVFGFNIGVSGGVTAMKSFLQTFFPKLIRESQAAHQSNYCKYDDQGLQAFTSSLYLAGLISTFAASYVTKNSGRRTTMIVAGLFSLAGVALTAGGQQLVMLLFGRILLGFGTGFANQAGPIYLSEIAPANVRGLLNSMFQMNVGVGILIANMVNFGAGYMAAHVGWRVALAVAGVPSLMLAIGSFLLVESPISLIERGKIEEGRTILQKVRGTTDVDEEFDEMMHACANAKAMPENPFLLVLKPSYRPQLVIALLTPMFQQLTGINAIMFYAPALFQIVGFKSNASLYSAVIVGGVNVLSTVISMFAVDRLGRKVLLVVGALQMIFAQVVIAAILGTSLKDVSVEGAPPLPFAAAIVVLLLICVFVAGFGWSWGPITWLICSEFFPVETRSAGQSIAVFSNLVGTFLIGQAFLSMLCGMKYWIFVFFAAWLVVMTLFVIFFVPETKNMMLDAIDQVWKTHWFWKTVVPDVASVGLPVATSHSRETSQSPYQANEHVHIGG